MVETYEYDLDESIWLAKALQTKAEQEVVSQGDNKETAKKQGVKKYNEVRRRHAIEFLQKTDMQLAVLSNQSIANLLKALIALGLSIDDEEELEYYINLLTKESLDRLTNYFKQRAEVGLLKQLAGLTGRSITANISEYSAVDIAAFSEMIKSLKKINKHMAKNKKIGQRRDSILGQIDKLLLKDIKAKQNSASIRQGAKKRQQSNENTLDILKSKMMAEGVVVGGRYWNSVIAEFDAELDKVIFAKNWVLDDQRRNENDVQKINELRGIKDSAKKKKQIQETKQQQQQEAKEQQSLLQQGREQKNQEKIRIEANKQKNKELIQKEFKNAKNQKAAEKYAAKKEQKTGKTLDEKDIKKMKLKAAKGKGR